MNIKENKELNLETKSHLSPMTVVGAVFAHSGLETFPKEMKFLQDFFRKSKENRRYSNLLKDFVFSEVDIYPYSRRLAECMGKLELARSLTWTYSGGGRAAKYRMEKGSRDQEIKIALEKNPSKKTQKLLKELGKNFRKASKRFYIQEEKEIEKSLIRPRKKKFWTIFTSK
jgi:hypothetical protein